MSDLRVLSQIRHRLLHEGNIGQSRNALKVVVAVVLAYNPTDSNFQAAKVPEVIGGFVWQGTNARHWDKDASTVCGDEGKLLDHAAADLQVDRVGGAIWIRMYFRPALSEVLAFLAALHLKGVVFVCDPQFGVIYVVLRPRAASKHFFEVMECRLGS